MSSSPHIETETAPEGATRYRVTFEADAAKARLDKALADALPDLSRARLQALIAEGQVTALDTPDTDDWRTVSDASEKTKPGAAYAIAVPPPAPAEPAAQDMPLDILYEDDCVIVVNKPPGLVVHPAAGNPQGTLVNALLAHCKDSLSGIGGVARPGIVHRLDKDTSGVMVVAKTDAAHKSLSDQFAAHGADGALERAYLALVWGAPRLTKFTIDVPLGRNVHDRKKVAVDRGPHGRRAVTHVTIRARYGTPERPLAALAECRLETGRTHQIRVHMAHEGLPVIGDQTYGRGQATRVNALPEEVQGPARAMHRQALHAYLLGFRHPENGEILRFEAPMPADMAALAQALETHMK